MKDCFVIHLDLFAVREIFIVSKVLYTNPVTYSLIDYNEEPIEGTFYNEELVRYNKQDEKYEVEKILKKRTKNGKKSSLLNGEVMDLSLIAENLH